MAEPTGSLLRVSEIEAWTISVADRVTSRQRIEDSRVEVKATFVDPVKAARRIAGHANAAGGELILWVLGLNEREGRAETPPKQNSQTGCRL